MSENVVVFLMVRARPAAFASTKIAVISISSIGLRDVAQTRSVDPGEQVAFYDPGLGSQADGGHIAGRLLRWVHNTVAQASGFGITRNIIDCYAALIRPWEPGDRIFLFRFSRGA